MPEFRSYHEAQIREASRRRRIRTGLVVLLAAVAIGWFTPDPLSYAVGVFVTITLGLIVNAASTDKEF